jgi:hypothetical protein
MALTKPYTFKFKRRSLENGWCEALITATAKWEPHRSKKGVWVRKADAPGPDFCGSELGRFRITVQGQRRRACGIHSVKQRQDAIYHRNRQAQTTRKAGV